MQFFVPHRFQVHVEAPQCVDVFDDFSDLCCGLGCVCLCLMEQVRDNTYDAHANRSLLKLYQFFPEHYREEVVVSVLIKVRRVRFWWGLPFLGCGYDVCVCVMVVCVDMMCV